MAQQTKLTDGGFEQRETAEEVFADTECDLEDILGTITYENRLYSLESYEEKAPVNILTGEKSVSKRSIKEAKEFAEESTREGGHQRVAVTRSTESMAEVGGGPYTATVFYDRKIVCGRVVGTDDLGMPEYKYDGFTRWEGYRAVASSERWEVRLENADYETGNVTITVEEVNES